MEQASIEFTKYSFTIIIRIRLLSCFTKFIFVFHLKEKYISPFFAWHASATFPIWSQALFLSLSPCKWYYSTQGYNYMFQETITIMGSY